MRLVIGVLAAVLILSGTTAAQPEYIGIFSDTRGCPCEIVDRAPGVINIVVLHLQSSGAKASQFSVPQPNCFNATFLFDTAVFPITLGASQTGIAISYEQCMTGTFQILSMTYFGQGTTWPCCTIDVRPDPYALSGNIDIYDCNDQLQLGYGWADIINSDSTCPCTAGLEYCYPVAVEEHTWGKIKSLYSS